MLYNTKLVEGATGSSDCDPSFVAGQNSADIATIQSQIQNITQMQSDIDDLKTNVAENTDNVTSLSNTISQQYQSAAPTTMDTDDVDVSSLT